MAEPVTNPDSQQQLAAGDVANAMQGGSSPIFAEEAGQIEPRHTGGRSTVPRAPGSSPLTGEQQADSAPRIGGEGGASPVLDGQQQRKGQAAKSGVADTCGFDGHQQMHC